MHLLVECNGDESETFAVITDVQRFITVVVEILRETGLPLGLPCQSLIVRRLSIVDGWMLTGEDCLTRQTSD